MNSLRSVLRTSVTKMVKNACQNQKYDFFSDPFKSYQHVSNLVRHLEFLMSISDCNNNSPLTHEQSKCLEAVQTSKMFVEWKEEHKHQTDLQLSQLAQHSTSKRETEVEPMTKLKPGPTESVPTPGRDRPRKHVHTDSMSYNEFHLFSMNFTSTGSRTKVSGIVEVILRYSVFK